MDELMNAAFADDAGEPAEALSDAPETDGGAVDAGVGDQDQASPEDAEPLFNREQYLAEHPELAPIAKQMQADYTRKTQELAEQRKQFEGLDEGTVQAIRYVNDLAARDPRAAAQWLKEQALQLEGTPAPDPYAEMEYATDVERKLAEDVRELRELVRQQEAHTRQFQIAQATNEIERGFTALEKTYGEIPQNERAATAAWMADRGMGVADLGHAYRALHFDKLVQAHSRKARDEASSVVTRKAGMAPLPGGLASREQAAQREPQSLREAVEWAIPE